LEDINFYERQNKILLYIDKNDKDAEI